MIHYPNKFYPNKGLGVRTGVKKLSKTECVAGFFIFILDTGSRGLFMIFPLLFVVYPCFMVQKYSKLRLSSPRITRAACMSNRN